MKMCIYSVYSVMTHANMPLIINY